MGAMKEYLMDCTHELAREAGVDEDWFYLNPRFKELAFAYTDLKLNLIAMEVKFYEQCPECKGTGVCSSGHRSPTTNWTCLKCNGTGRVPKKLAK